MSRTHHSIDRNAPVSAGLVWKALGIGAAAFAMVFAAVRVVEISESVLAPVAAARALTWTAPPPVDAPSAAMGAVVYLPDVLQVQAAGTADPVATF